MAIVYNFCLCDKLTW